MRFPLTEFLIELLKCPTDKLAKADPAKLAARWGIREEHARDYINLELEQRGHVSQERKKAA